MEYMYAKGDVFLRFKGKMKEKIKGKEIVVVRKMGILLLMAALAGIIVVSQKTGEYLNSRNKKEVETSGKLKEKAEKEEQTVILDSGHGGRDPGKIGTQGTKEKEMNLCIAKKVERHLKEAGITVIMTRTDDAGMADSQVEDLKERVKLINETKPVLAVSIHQNSYPDPSVFGTQVFYYTHSREGENAAKVVQEALQKVELQKNREIKANDTYYMLKKTEPPVLIVECGFLSNPEEEALLCEDAYQEKLAEGIANGILSYLQI